MLRSGRPALARALCGALLSSILCGGLRATTVGLEVDTASIEAPIRGIAPLSLGEKESAASSWFTDVLNRNDDFKDGFNAAVVSQLYAGLGDSATWEGCAEPLLAKSTVDRDQWDYIKDWNHKYFLRRRGKPLGHQERTTDPILFSTGKLWNQTAPPFGALSVVPGMRLIDVNGQREPGWSWFQLLAAVPFEQNLTDEQMPLSFEFAFHAGYDLRACWGDTVTYDDMHVCGPEPLKELAEELANAEATITPGGPLSIKGLRNYEVKRMDEETVNLLRTVAPLLKADGDRRQNEQQDLCYRTVVTPICVVLQLPGVCRGTTDCLDESADNIPDVFWAAERIVQLGGPNYEKRQVVLNRDAVEGVHLKGPQVGRIANFMFASALDNYVWHRQDSGYARMFPEGMDLDSCGSREVALAVQLESQFLQAQNMTDYDLSLMFHIEVVEEGDSERASPNCECQAISKGQAYWPLLMSGIHPATGIHVKFATAITRWLDQDVRSLLAVAGQNRAPDTYREHFMRMWPQYFKLEKRFFPLYRNGASCTEEPADKSCNIIEKTSEEPAEILDKNTRIRALVMINFKGGWLCAEAWNNFVSNSPLAYAFTAQACMGDLTVDHKNYTFYVQQLQDGLLQSFTGLPNLKFGGWSNFMIMPGDEGVVVDVLRPGGSHAPMLAVQFDKFPNSSGRAPVFKVFPHQVMAVNRTVVREVVPTPAPTPAPTPTTTAARDGYNGAAPLHGNAALSFVLAALFVALRGAA